MTETTNDTPARVEAVESAWARTPLWVAESDISANAVRVYVVMHRWRGHMNSACWPSVRLIAERARVSARTVQRAIKELVDIGAIEVVERSDANGQTSNLYRLFYEPPVSDLSPPGDTGVTPRNSAGLRGVQAAPPDTGVTGPPTLVSPELEPINQIPLLVTDRSSENDLIETGSRSDAAPPSPPPEPFDSFWTRWPNKRGKARARERWVKLKHSDRVAALAGIDAYTADTVRAGRDFVHGDTYLSQRRWEDYEDVDGVEGGVSFREFIDLWPSQAGRAKAERAWGLLSEADRKAAVEATPTYLDTVRRDRSIVVHCSTFLEDRRFEDHGPGAEGSLVASAQRKRLEAEKLAAMRAEDPWAIINADRERQGIGS